MSVSLRCPRSRRDAVRCTIVVRSTANKGAGTLERSWSRNVVPPPTPGRKRRSSCESEEPGITSGQGEGGRTRGSAGGCRTEPPHLRKSPRTEGPARGAGGRRSLRWPRLKLSGRRRGPFDWRPAGPRRVESGPFRLRRRPGAVRRCRRAVRGGSRSGAEHAAASWSAGPWPPRGRSGQRE